MVSEGETPPTALIEIVARQIAAVIGADSCRYEPGPIRDARIAVLEHDGVLTRGDHAVDVDRLGLPTDDYAAVVVRGGSVPVGHFLDQIAGVAGSH